MSEYCKASETHIFKSRMAGQILQNKFFQIENQEYCKEEKKLICPDKGPHIF